MFEALISWFLGYVDFKMIGKYPERLLTLAARNGIRIWKIKSGEIFTARTGIESYRMLRFYTRRCKMRTAIVKKSGFPFVIRQMKKRIGIGIGIFVFIIVYFVLSSYVWSVDVEGNKDLRSEDILQIAQDCGLQPGTLKSHLDSYDLENQLMLKIPELSWVSVNRYGCGVSIAVKEKIEAPEIIDTSQPSNLVASCDGQIIALELFGGEAKVKVGDGVVKGQLLVSGIVQFNENDISLKHSYGRVLAETHHTLSVIVSKQQTEKLLSEENAVYRCSARVFGVQLPLSFAGAPKGDYEHTVTEEPFRIGKVVLPVSVLKEKWTAYETAEKQISLVQAKILANEILQTQMEKDYPRAEILQKEISVEENEEDFTVIWEVKCKEDIALQSAVLGE